jgi:hypothetical protein
MDDVPRREPSGTRRNGRAERDRSFRDRLALNLLAAGPLDRPRDARAHPQTIVGGVGDRVERKRGDVALDDFELEHGRKVHASRAGEAWHAVVAVSFRSSQGHARAEAGEHVRARPCEAWHAVVTVSFAVSAQTGRKRSGSN